MIALEAWGHRVIGFLQGARSPLVDGLAMGVSFLGDELFYLLLIPVLYWTVDRATAARLAVLMLASTWLNGALKGALDLPRPDPGMVAVLEERDSGGLPSGHAQNAVVVWGFLAWAVARFRTLPGSGPPSLARALSHVHGKPFAAAFSRVRALSLVGALVLVVAIGLSRIYLGAHFPHDVAVGWAVGAVLLAVYLRERSRIEGWLAGVPARPRPGPRPRTQPRTRPRPRPRPTGPQSPPVSLPEGIRLPAALVLAVTLPLLMLVVYRDHEALAAAAALLGAGTGIVWERRWIRFSARAPLLHLGVRLVLGMSVALVIYAGLSAPLAPLGEGGRILRYALLGLWITGGAPWVFGRLGVGGGEGRRPPL
jgi:membrane-associated phospholipid phosphatase